MCANDRISERIKAKQKNAFRLAERDFAQNHKEIAEDAGIHVNSVGNYSRGETVMGLAAFYKLCGVMPNELLSMLLPPGFALVRIPENLNHDDAMRVITEFSMLKMAAHCADSPAGPEISECEDLALREKWTQVVAQMAGDA